ncbi:MAG: glycosyltransferase family 9 protein, partial [Gemmatimonadaceae bacterium]|nr:glycosyltransferase family 9 protein [Gemmatimonadaceae bacterium]
YDTAYLAQGSARSATLAWLARIPRRIGFDTSAGRRWYTDRIRYDATAHHATRLLSLAGVHRRGPLRPSLHPSAQATDHAIALLAQFPADDRRPIVALAPGSVWATKRWPHYPALAATLAPHVRLLLIGGPDDQPLAATIREAAGPGAALIDTVGQVPLPVSAALLAGVQAVVTNDSLPLHLASAMDTPTVAIFGPTVPAFGFGPLASRAVVVEHEAMPCRPCHAHGPMRCPLTHFRCMVDVSVARVRRALAELDVVPPI